MLRLNLAQLAIIALLLAYPGVSSAIDLEPTDKQSTATTTTQQRQKPAPQTPAGTYYIGGGKQNAWFVNTADIRSTGSTKLAWTVIENEIYQTLPSGNKYLEEKSIDRYDCTQRRMENVQSTYYDQEGHVVYTADFSPGYSFVVPGSVGETALNFVCDPTKAIATNRNIMRVPAGTKLFEFAYFLIFKTYDPSDCEGNTIGNRLLGYSESAVEAIKVGCLARQTAP